MLNDLERVLFDAPALADRARELGQEITHHYKKQGVQELVLICVTNGALVFTADLMRHLEMPILLDCIRVSSYLDGTKPLQEPRILYGIHQPLEGAHVLVIDDILDTGKTFNLLTNLFAAQKPASLKTCVLLDKKARRAVEFKADFTGFEIPDEFVVGYGLDFAGRYRNLPCVGVLRKDLRPNHS